MSLSSSVETKYDGALRRRYYNRHHQLAQSRLRCRIAHAKSCHEAPHEFWCFMSKMNHENKGIKLIDSVVMRICSMLPNSADPERIFSELGRTVAPPRVNLNLSKVQHTALISSDIRYCSRRNSSNSSAATRQSNYYSKVLQMIRVVLRSDHDINDVQIYLTLQRQSRHKSHASA